VDITTVADDLIMCHDGATVVRLENLRPASTHDVRGVEVRTLPRPAGELLCRFATANDLHFGEVDCGSVDNQLGGPIQRAAEGEPPYAEMMNRDAALEIASIEPAAVIVKGDLPGTWAEYRVFAGGIMQVVHRVSTSEALNWSERCRHLYRDFGIDYETYALGALEDRCCNIPLR